MRELIPEPALRRLPWYLAYVSTLKARGVAYVSSTTISREINVDASQIAKDLSFINIKGKTPCYRHHPFHNMVCNFSAR